MSPARLQLTDISKRYPAVLANDRVALIVTEPLTTNETWQAFEANELKVFVDGAPLPSA
jgi:glutamine amidotransferase